MKIIDVELINRILNGDDTAFTELVKKYQKPVHALVWRKIGDFHIAEEITQDTFLKAYQGLATLKKPQSFASWLYVIATNNSNTWLRKKRLRTQSLEDIRNSQFGKATYSQYVVEEKERAASEAQREVVKKLLAKLPESERTIITLHYFSDMSSAEIGAFLGVSANTIRSRLRRAQQRLQKEETMIREALDHFQISPNLTDNIMQEVARLKPATPSGSKPLMPWIAAASSVVLIVLMLGLGSQYLARFQKPYSLDAQAETTVELVDAPIVLNVDAKPDIRHQLGNSKALGENESNGQKPNEVLLAAAETEGEDVSVPKQQWIQSEPIKGSQVYSLKGTTEGGLYVLVRNLGSPNILKLTSDGKTWQSMDGYPSGTVWGFNVPMVEWNNTFYAIPFNELFASKDEGKTWKSLYTWSDEHNVIDFLPTDNAFYAAFHEGIYRSDDSGKTWKAIQDEQIKSIESLVKIQNILFVETYNSLYRLDDEGLNSLEFPVPVRSIISVAGTDGKLYVAVTSKSVTEARSWWIFRSTDLGDSWIDITPTNAWSIEGQPPYFKLIASEETLLVMEQGMVRSTDGGNTWLPPQLPGSTPSMRSTYNAVAVNQDTYYVGSSDGLHRSTNGGKSWDLVRVAPDMRRRVLFNLIATINSDESQNLMPKLYGIVEVGEMTRTNDDGKSWKTVRVDTPMSTLYRGNVPTITQIVKSGDDIYVKGGSLGEGKVGHYIVSDNGNTLVPIQDMPTFSSTELRMHLFSSKDLTIEELQEDFSGAKNFFQQMLTSNPQQLIKLEGLGLRGPFTVSGDIFYTEYNLKLFRWNPGDTEWYDTGQEDIGDFPLDGLFISTFKSHFIIPKLAAYDNTVYYGKRNGQLVVSFDRGNNWVDLTPGLPYQVKTYKSIVFAGSTVYVATNAGIITSDDGRSWQVVTDSEGSNIIMEHLAADGTTLYGITNTTSIYRLNSESGTWEQVVTDIPEIVNLKIGDFVTSLAVAGRTLYVSTEINGMFHFTLEE
ncbi:MAG: sigma-70 family RNA polymerase sigma factor [Candidatus Poribacteria bacterium]|nr:sigma-70 family RNA polymerase sigma factor [Candidatus Poribacteria bacterium]